MRGSLLLPQGGRALDKERVDKIDDNLIDELPVPVTLPAGNLARTVQSAAQHSLQAPGAENSEERTSNLSGGEYAHLLERGTVYMPSSASQVLHVNMSMPSSA